MTQIEFESNYIKNHGVTIEEYSKTKFTTPCNCGESCCCGWFATPRHLVIETQCFWCAPVLRKEDLPNPADEFPNWIDGSQAFSYDEGKSDLSYDSFFMFKNGKWSEDSICIC